MLILEWEGVGFSIGAAVSLIAELFKNFIPRSHREEPIIRVGGQSIGHLKPRASPRNTEMHSATDLFNKATLNQYGGEKFPAGGSKELSL